MTPRRHIDLCSGIGGFALAAHWAGYKTEVFCERDEFCQKVLRKHWPSVPIISDLFDFDGRPYAGADLLTAGIPCQPYSCAGKRLGDDDDRALWPEARRIIAEVRPRYVLLENVAGFINLALDGVLADLEAQGYETWAVVLPACAVNAPHRRDRVWVVAHRTGEFGDERLYGIGNQSDAESRDGRKTGTARKAVAHADETGRIEQRRTLATSSEQPAAECRRPCQFCGYEFDHERLGKYGCPNCCGEGLDDGKFEPRLDGMADGLPARLDGHFDREPAIPRVASGIPQRAARLKALGNAIVPQVAYQILCRLAQVDFWLTNSVKTRIEIRVNT